MSCNGKSVNLNISKSAFCHIYAHSKNIREISSTPMKKGRTISLSMHSKTEILVKKKLKLMMRTFC